MARVQVGIIAKRDAAGNFLPAKPIFREVEQKETSLTGHEEKQCRNFAQFLCEKYFKPYMEGLKGVTNENI